MPSLAVFQLYVGEVWRNQRGNHTP